MEKKTARLTVLIDPDKKKATEDLCLQQDVTPSRGTPADPRLPA